MAGFGVDEGVPRCEHSEQWGFPERGRPGFPENELVEFLGVHGRGTPRAAQAAQFVGSGDTLFCKNYITLAFFIIF
jgi:hypothetical protein